MGTAIELRDIVKRFPGVVANDGVNLQVETGTIHALIGENGAGKSTVMKILYGAQPPDEGTIEVNGQQVHFKSPKDAIDLGIGMVFQHFMLAENLTVWENVVLGSEPGKGSRLDAKSAISTLRALAEKNGLDVDPTAYISDLGVGERQRVEILKVLYRGAKIIILDEPTAVLVPQEVDALFANLRQLKDQGHTLIFISHKLDEVLSVADAITVIRQGKTVAEVDDRCGPSLAAAVRLAARRRGGGEGGRPCLYRQRALQCSDRDDRPCRRPCHRSVADLLHRPCDRSKHRAPLIQRASGRAEAMNVY